MATESLVLEPTPWLAGKRQPWSWDQPATTGQPRQDAGKGPPSCHWVAFPTHCEACIWVPFDSNGVLGFRVSSSPSIYKLGTTSRALRREPPVRPASDVRVTTGPGGGKAVSSSQWRDTQGWQSSLRLAQLDGKPYLPYPCWILIGCDAKSLRYSSNLLDNKFTSCKENRDWSARSRTLW